MRRQGMDGPLACGLSFEDGNEQDASYGHKNLSSRAGVARVVLLNV
jgi:hypothetical protein